jgi:zinc transport system permease protein
VAHLHFALIILMSLSIVLVIRMIGLILVIALLSIPPYIAEKYCRSLAGMMVLSSLLSLAFSLSGLFLAYRFNLTSGAAIIIVAAAAYLASELWLRCRTAARA